MKHCVYLTVYHGSLLPPFYIGHSTVKRIDNGYRGSVSSKKYKDIWKTEPNDMFSTHVLKRFHSKKEAADYEEKIQRQLDVIKNPLYINMSFCPYGCRLGYKNSPEHRQKISDALKGRKMNPEHKKKFLENRNTIPWNKGKKGLQEAWNSGERGRKYPKRKSPSSRGRTYEEIYGVEKAAELKLLRSEKMKETRARMKELGIK